MTQQAASSPPRGTPTTPPTPGSEGPKGDAAAFPLLATMAKYGIPATLESYVELNWMGGATVEEALADAEMRDQIPPELLPEEGPEDETEGTSPPGTPPKA